MGTASIDQDMRETARISRDRGRSANATTRDRAAGPAEISQAAFAARLAAAARDVERLLDRLLSVKPAQHEIVRPRRLIEAMRYATLGGGKRLRPLLVIESASLFGVPRPRALMTAAAVECVHCYSLVHDDLPAMDNDTLRRGQLTVHRAYDEATAILVGDSLLTFAFDVLARTETHPDPAVRVALIGALARAAGLGGMAGGQLLDLAAEGRYGRARLAEKDIAMLHAMKTGALIRFTCEAGAILADAPQAAHEALGRYGRALGQAFQIADDLLDLEGDASVVGKKTGKDAKQGKATLVAALGRDGAHARLAALTVTAERALRPLGARAGMLRAAARFVATRRT